MENTSCRISDGPCKLPYQLLQTITNDFSEERKLGCGTFGQVYKGVFEDGEEIAVKILRFIIDNEQSFQNEFENLKRLDHENIVRLLGFCDESEEVVVELNGKKISCCRIHRALCLEYMPNGSLTKLLSGEYIRKKNWPTLYRIIKGICEGLNYLHEGLDDPILHLDLKPDNILLDQYMMPKIADFGLSRLIGEENTKCTLSPLGTLGYLPPEFIRRGVISREYDIFSLGVIITKIIVGLEGYSSIVDVDSLEFTDHMYNNWKNLQEISKYALVQPDYCTQVRGCIEIAVKCMDKDRRKRPRVKDVISKLKEIEHFSSLQQHLRTALDVCNIQRMHMQQQNKAEVPQQPRDHQQQMVWMQQQSQQNQLQGSQQQKVLMQQQSQQNQLQGSQYNIMPQFQAQAIERQQPLLVPQQSSLMPQQPSLPLHFTNKPIQQININLQMQYIQEQRGLQEVASNRLHDMRNRRTTEWTSGMCGPRGSGLFGSGLNW
ncbi:unnamed protein product [Urochloa humidicola]